LEEHFECIFQRSIIDLLSLALLLLLKHCKQGRFGHFTEESKENYQENFTANIFASALASSTFRAS